MIIWTLIVGFSFLAATKMTKGLPYLPMTAIRFLLASIIMLPWLLRQPVRWPPTRQALRCYVVLSLCAGIFFATVFLAGKKSPALHMATIYLSIPLFSLFFAVILKVEQWQWKKFLLFLLGTIGAVLLGFSQYLSNLEHLSSQFVFGEGEKIFLIGCAMIALYPVLSKRYIQQEKMPEMPLLSTFWSLFSGGAIMAAMVSLLDPAQWTTLLEQANAQDYVLLLFLTLLSTTLTFFIVQKATISLMPTQITAYNFLLPLVSLTYVWINQEIPFDWLILPGIALVLITLWLINQQPET